VSLRQCCILSAIWLILHGLKKQAKITTIIVGIREATVYVTKLNSILKLNFWNRIQEEKNILKKSNLILYWESVTSIDRLHFINPTKCAVNENKITLCNKNRPKNMNYGKLKDTSSDSKTLNFLIKMSFWYVAKFKIGLFTVYAVNWRRNIGTILIWS
jgi:hypothetical protein